MSSERTNDSRSGQVPKSLVLSSYSDLMDVLPRRVAGAFSEREDETVERYDMFIGGKVRDGLLGLLEIANLRYEIGDSVAMLAERWSDSWETLTALHERKKVTHTAAGFAEDRDFTNLHNLWKEIASFSWSLLLGIPKNELARFDEWFPGGGDLSYDSLVASVVPGRMIAESPGVERPYRLLADVWTCPVEEREARLGKFVKNWYGQMRKIYWWHTHKKGQHRFIGYWNVEAAATAVVLGIDDSSFRDHLHYPADLADFARECSSPAP